MSESMIVRTVRFDPALDDAIIATADDLGLEVNDFIVKVLAEKTLDRVRMTDPREALRLTREIEIKTAAATLARRLVPGQTTPERSDLTLQVFRAIGADPALKRVYDGAIEEPEPAPEGALPERAGPDGEGDDGEGAPIKDRINKAIGATVRKAAGARPLMRGGKPVKMRVRGEGELIASYTVLVLPSKADGESAE
jgi:hypothetical protein